MKNKTVIVNLLIIILLISLGFYFYNFFLNKKEETSRQEKNQDSSLTLVKENEYYVIYIKLNNGAGSSFVPLMLNPGLKNDSNFNVNISFDDDGNIINDDKIIVIDNFVISQENKEMIKEIAGIKNYDEALKEIEERIDDTKKNLEKEGLIK